MKVGDTAIGCNFVIQTEHNGMECEIIEEARNRRITCINGIPCEPFYGYRYKVEWANGRKTYAAPHLLRPKDEPGDWETLNDEQGKPIWRPEVMV